jgi:hypothetical protein
MEKRQTKTTETTEVIETFNQPGLLEIIVQEHRDRVEDLTEVTVLVEYQVQCCGHWAVERSERVTSVNGRISIEPPGYGERITILNVD